MSTRTAFCTYSNFPVADGACGPDIQWVTVYFDPQEAKLNDVDLVCLMMYRVVNRQVEVDNLPMHHRYSHCLSIRIAGPLPADGTVYGAAESILDCFYDRIISGELIVNRSYIFRRRSMVLF